MSGSRFDPRVVDSFLTAVAAGDITPPEPSSPPPDTPTQEVS
jgi:hypothetical protein